MDQYSDPQVNFPIPNEKRMMQAAAEGSSNVEPSRKIAYRGTDPSVGKLPVEPDGLMWRGKPSITTRQLQQQGEQQIRAMITRNQLKNSRIMTRSMKD